MSCQPAGRATARYYQRGVSEAAGQTTCCLRMQPDDSLTSKLHCTEDNAADGELKPYLISEREPATHQIGKSRDFEGHADEGHAVHCRGSPG